MYLDDINICNDLVMNWNVLQAGNIIISTNLTIVRHKIMGGSK